MRIDIWSDVICPWCFLGKRRLETALGLFEHAEQVEVHWRAFELDPNAPPVREGDPAERIARKYGITADQARAANRRLTGLAAAEDLDYHLDRTRSGNSFDAHRLIHLGADRGIQDRVKERFLSAYLCEGQAIGDPAVLRSQSAAAGLDIDDVDTVLAGDKYSAEVRADQAEAREREITGVPFFLIDGRFGIPGAQETDTILAVLRRAWAKAQESRSPT
ncbi:MAG TPA: DsbA family oxidoreductase [Acidimicrobiales bacterium]|nr:DsbA family oxidoreductase [Acidimicrobiales bacterium]